MNQSARVELQTEVFGQIFLLTQHLTNRTDDELEPLGLTTKQWLLLAVLAKSFPGECPTLSEAAREYGSSRQNVKQIALQLENRGYLALVTDPRDRRALRLKLTDKIAAFEDPQEISREVAVMDELFKGLEAQEIEQLRAVFHKWLKALLA